MTKQSAQLSNNLKNNKYIIITNKTPNKMDENLKSLKTSEKNFKVLFVYMTT